jgi:hypothetical protein
MLLDKLVKSLLTQDRLDRLGFRQTTQEDLNQNVPLVEFYCDPKLRDVVVEPIPAFKAIAQWYKDIPADLPLQHTPRDHLGSPVMTAKKCLPLLDGMSMAYLMRSAVDIRVRVDQSGRNMEVRSGNSFNGGSTHDPIQFARVKREPGAKPVTPALKFHNPWVIKTRPGYSTLFISPLNWIEESRFRCLSAAVSTDTYKKEINFPALWLGGNDFDDTIPAGTPLVLAIPYRRADHQGDAALIRSMQPHEKHFIETVGRAQMARAHVYTNELRQEGKK